MAGRHRGHLRLVSTNRDMEESGRGGGTFRITEREFIKRYLIAYNTPGALIVAKVGTPDLNEAAWVMVDEQRIAVSALRGTGDPMYGYLCSDTYNVVGAKRGDVVELTTNGEKPPMGRVVEQGFL